MNKDKKKMRTKKFNEETGLKRKELLVGNLSFSPDSRAKWNKKKRKKKKSRKSPFLVFIYKFWKIVEKF